MIKSSEPHNLLPGPYFKFRTYDDAMRNREVRKIEVGPFIVKRIQSLPLYAIGFVLMSYFFDVKV